MLVGSWPSRQQIQAQLSRRGFFFLLVLWCLELLFALNPHFAQFFLDVLLPLLPLVHLGKLLPQFLDFLQHAILFTGSANTNEFVLVGLFTETQSEGV